VTISVEIGAIGVAFDVAHANAEAIATAEIAYITRFMTLSLKNDLSNKIEK
jgi:hypothetical protein